ncbi:MAG: peptide deformylase [Alphaproteobacteria bacterium]|nr:peptide deformylase [Alphaproteobacteria bacterium]
MSRLPLVIAPDPVLKKKTEAVADIDDDIRRLMDDMVETMYAERGMGLAAPQVGVLKRVFVMDVGADGGERRLVKLANPEIVWASEETKFYEEGCLSIPGQFAEVERPAAVKVRYLNYDGEVREIEDDGVLAVCAQHEIDHLDGVLFVDHLSTLKRNMFLRKSKKYKKDRERDQAKESA